jgi:cytochrome c-type biogenesis protein CcmH
LVLVAVVVLVVTAGLWFGRHRNPAAPAPTATAPLPGASSAAPAPLSASQVERGIAHARERVQQDPKDAAGWAMLAHSYEMVGRFEEAGQAFGKLLELRPQDAQAHADGADAIGVAHHGSLAGEPARLIAKALTLDPANLKALVLAGKEAFERKQYREAVKFWQRALATQPEPPVRRSIETSIAEATALSSPLAGEKPVPSGLAFIAGHVAVAPALKAQIRPDDAVFIYARASAGSRMPVALLRKRGSDLPLDFALDDTLAMVPQALLSQHAQVTVGVRVSRRGDAIPVVGDLEGEVPAVKLGATGVQVEINRVHP